MQRSGVQRLLQAFQNRVGSKWIQYEFGQEPHYCHLMTIKKALHLTEWLLQNNTQSRNGLLNPEIPWNQDDMLKKLSSVIVEMTDRDSKVLREIRKELIGMVGIQKRCTICVRVKNIAWLVIWTSNPIF